MRKTYPWHAIDWSIPTQVLAEILGTTPQHVSEARKRLAPESRGKVHGSKVKAAQRGKR